MTYYGGVEGGGTCSTAVIMDASGKVLGTAKGDGTNQFLVGLDTCCERLDSIIADAKKAVSARAFLALMIRRFASGCSDEATCPAAFG